MMRLLIAICLLATTAAAVTEKKCKLIGMAPDKPFPSLTQCYKDNQRSCCVSAHDEQIANEYGNLLSGTCLREFSMLEMYFCLGCNPKQPEYIQGYVDAAGTCGNRTLHICKSFADHLFGFVADSTGSPNNFKCPANSNVGSDKLCKDGIRQYDRCGFKSESDGAYLPSEKFAKGNSCVGDGACSITAQQITDAQTEFFKHIRPPFFDKPDNTTCTGGLYTGYEIVFEADSATCLSAASAISYSPLALALGLVAMLMNLMQQ